MEIRNMYIAIYRDGSGKQSAQINKDFIIALAHSHALCHVNIPIYIGDMHVQVVKDFIEIRIM